jgi:two-component system chemotaxis response regulator CheY
MKKSISNSDSVPKADAWGEHPTDYSHYYALTFSIYLQSNMRNKKSSRAEATAGAPAGYVPYRRTPSILVVDDDNAIRQFNAEALSGSGYQVDVVEDGAAGWVALNANNYDLLITDQNMPGLTGSNLIKKLHAAHMAVPVILASGAPSGEESELQLAALLPKPFSLDQLLGTVRQVLWAVENEREPANQPPIAQNPPPDDDFRL